MEDMDKISITFDVCRFGSLEVPKKCSGLWYLRILCNTRELKFSEWGTGAGVPVNIIKQLDGSLDRNNKYAAPAEQLLEFVLKHSMSMTLCF